MTFFYNILRCPETGKPLRFENNHFISPSGKSWPVVSNIPRFVSSDLYTDSFSFQWNIHPKTQLDSFTGRTAAEEELRQKTGLDKEQVSGKMVLDAGIGTGRFADVLSRWGAYVVGVDLSYSVEAAYNNLHDKPNVMIVQADIGHLPLALESFDIIISIGVLHHTPDAKTYFKKLTTYLKPGGEICIWVYPDTGQYVNRAAWIPFTSRIPKRWFHDWCHWFIPLMESLKPKLFYKFIWKLFPFSISDFGLEYNILNTFDGYSPKYHEIHSPEEVSSWFQEEGLDNIRVYDFFTAVRGRRPQ